MDNFFEIYRIGNFPKTKKVTNTICENINEFEIFSQGKPPDSLLPSHQQADEHERCWQFVKCTKKSAFYMTFIAQNRLQ